MTADTDSKSIRGAGPGRARGTGTRSAVMSLGRGQAGDEGGAADRVQHEVGALAAGQPQYLGGDVGVAVVDDVVGAQRLHRLVLAR